MGSIVPCRPTSGTNRPQLLVSFSGGETSGYMAKRIKEECSDEYDLLFIMANTGEENHQTLEFARRCDEAFELNLVLVEAVVHQGKRQGTTHRVVTWDTASMRGEPYEAMVQKYGIPNKNYPHCTRELKLSPINSYAKSIGWKQYLTAVGIRTDEKRRVRDAADAARIVYPLVDWWPTDKQDVNDFWEGQPFRLDLKDYEGNCKWCWKKSDAKLLRIMSERPEVFDFPDRIEREYSTRGAGAEATPRVFFRGRRSTEDLRALHATVGSRVIPIRPDEDSGCSESCELYATEAA